MSPLIPRRALTAFASSVALLAPWMVCAAEAPAPPVAQKIAHESVLHGETRQDPYYWLREKENPEERPQWPRIR